MSVGAAKSYGKDRGHRKGGKLGTVYNLSNTLSEDLGLDLGQQEASRNNLGICGRRHLVLRIKARGSDDQGKTWDSTAHT